MRCKSRAKEREKRDVPSILTRLAEARAMTKQDSILFEHVHGSTSTAAVLCATRATGMLFYCLSCWNAVSMPLQCSVSVCLSVRSCKGDESTNSLWPCKTAALKHATALSLSLLTPFHHLQSNPIY